MNKIGRLALGFVLALAACGGGSTQPAASSQSPAAPPKGPATAQLTFVGDASLAGPASAQPSCNFPGVDATTISIFVQPPDQTVLDRVVVAAGKVSVRVAAGSGTEYRERDFEGTGVTGFDPATGAQIDSPLTETPLAAGQNPGSLGAITSIKGSVDCGNQTTGTSTVAVTGSTAEGSIGAPDPISRRVRHR